MTCVPTPTPRPATGTWPGPVACSAQLSVVQGCTAPTFPLWEPGRHEAQGVPSSQQSLEGSSWILPSQRGCPGQYHREQKWATPPGPCYAIMQLAKNEDALYELIQGDIQHAFAKLRKWVCSKLLMSAVTHINAGTWQYGCTGWNTEILLSWLLHGHTPRSWIPSTSTVYPTWLPRDPVNTELPRAGMGSGRPVDTEVDGTRGVRETLQTRPFNILLIELCEYGTYLIT